MKLHTDTITGADIVRAAREAGVTVESQAQVGSRSHDHGFLIYLSGSSRRMSNGRDHYAATWDEWGAFMAALYRTDPGAMWGSKAYGYKDAEDFHRQTCERFRDGMPEDAHRQHKWTYDYKNSRSWSGNPVYNCTGCSARHTR